MNEDNLALPLDEWHRANGARMVPFAGYAMPLQFAGIVAEHEWTRSHASLFDVSHMGQISISGTGAQALLERLLPADVAGLRDGRVRYSMLLNDSGGIIDDLMLTRRADDYLLVVNGAVKHNDMAHILAHTSGDAQVTMLPDMALLALQGPEAAAVLAPLVPGADQLGFMTAAAFDWKGAELWISRSGYSGEDGYEIALPAASAAAFAAALMTDHRCLPAGLGSRDSLRLEAGLPLYGHDMDTQIDPVSAGLGFALSKKRREEGSFIGAPSVVAILEDGPDRQRTGLIVQGRLPAREGAEVLHNNAVVGTITSGGFSPTLGHPIAMAYLPTNLSPPGTALTIAVRGKMLDARTALMPFVPHRYYRKGTV